MKKANIDSPIDVTFSVFDLVILILKILAKICFNSNKKDVRIERPYNCGLILIIIHLSD
ncbi:hypothetical protein [Defluviitoga tunisiensis]|uniref:hypothetical protein n=1 Tax=Defluviitoga tunisiensis TaxID=1006576 RepID=UPI00149405A2|nr:hypothetical protein [Defluviitoga tunisiensis]